MSAPRPRVRYSLAFFLLLLIFSVRDAGCSLPKTAKPPEDQAPPSAAPRPANVFEDGESVRFGIYTTGLKVGSGTLTYEGPKETKGQILQHIAFRAVTLSVEDREDVYGTFDFTSPVRVERFVKLFGKKEFIVEEYSSDASEVEITKTVGSNPTAKQRISVAEPLQNVLLLIYRLRNIEDLREGRVFEITLPTQKFTLVVRDRRIIKVPMGTFEAFYLESQPPKYRIWLSTSRERTPLRLQGLIAGGAAYLAALEVN